MSLLFFCVRFWKSALSTVKRELGRGFSINATSPQGALRLLSTRRQTQVLQVEVVGDVVDASS